ncbi:hypothetical protein SKAU_G00405990 [Synaphobranchus kaupii]|uniref:Uncharacterized protein n=1 Tax=Synaphobranchus kaupii TaxID=118154 RepID=A0A9Q1E9X4_SYNKA|nr:hypothetical protein SKAU_G00405990 [Synaphobranchus kaupii]
MPSPVGVTDLNQSLSLSVEWDLLIGPNKLMIGSSTHCIGSLLSIWEGVAQQLVGGEAPMPRRWAGHMTQAHVRLGPE